VQLARVARQRAMQRLWRIFEVALMHRTIRVVFTRHILRQSASYKCTNCKKSYKRSKSEEWTENPYNTKPPAELDADRKERLKIYLYQQECPGCETINKPVSTSAVSKDIKY
jgi:hypothetical protein